jgi:hypothetical protein
MFLHQSLVPLTNIFKANFSLFISFLMLVCYLLIIYLTINTIYHLLKVLKGKINTDVYSEKELHTNSLLFFGTISQLKYMDFKKEINDANENTEMDDLTSQIFINSKICKKKFDHYNNAIKSFQKLLVLFLITFILIVIKSYI